MTIRVTAARRVPLLPPPPPLFPRRRFSLGVPFEEQVHLNWCWAACIFMILHYLREEEDRSVNAIAGAGLSCEHCEDDDPPRDTCKLGIPVSAILPKWTFFQVDAEAVADLEEATLKTILENERKPVQVFYRENHVVLVVGTWRDDLGAAGFLVHDPLKGEDLELEWGTLRGLQGERSQHSVKINREVT